MPIAMVIVVRKGNPLVKARRLSDLAEAPWVYTGATPDAGYAKTLYESHGLKPPPAGALVNSTLGLLSVIASGNCVGLLPLQIARHPFASQYLEVVPVARRAAEPDAGGAGAQRCDPEAERAALPGAPAPRSTPSHPGWAALNTGAVRACPP